MENSFTKNEQIIIDYLTEGKTQAEIADLLKVQGIKPNSLSHIEKLLKTLRKKLGAKTMFHLAIILNK